MAQFKKYGVALIFHSLTLELALGFKFYLKNFSSRLE